MAKIVFNKNLTLIRIQSGLGSCDPVEQDRKTVRASVKLMSAILDSMPSTASAETNETPVKAFHEGHQRALFCDVMGHSESEYWNSTNREIAQRIDCYLEINGEKETANLVQTFDDD